MRIEHVAVWTRHSVHNQGTYSVECAGLTPHVGGRRPALGKRSPVGAGF